MSTAWTHRNPVGVPASHARSSSQMAFPNRGQTAQLQTATAMRKADQRRVRITMRIIPRTVAVLIAACCAAATLTASPAAAASTPLGGKHMGTSGTVQSPGTVRISATVQARGFMVADMTTGAVYAARRPHQRTGPASTLKVLTALTLIRKYPAGHYIKMTPKVRGAECSCVGLKMNRTYVLEDLLHALIMRSGNDVAELAAMAPGSRTRTLTWMNSYARGLQARDTKAMTPSGLPASGQTTSAYDLALITRAAYEEPRFREIMAARSHMFGPAGAQTKKLAAQNEMYLMGYRGQLGSKNGWTRASKQTFVAVAKRGNRTLVVTLVNNEKGVAKQAAKLLDWGFSLPANAKPVGTLVDPLS
jgi:D-alanyl-D-alanine carboxypeptidase (penicillin-binding protein 5/6)